ADEATISNLRLLDPDILSPTFTQMQQLRNFYGFADTLSMDRYIVDGELRDFVAAAREVDPHALRENQQNWIHRTTVYPHGKGFVAAQANRVDEDAHDADATRRAAPVVNASDLQTEAGEDAEGAGEALDAVSELGINVEQPRMYSAPASASAEDSADDAI